MNWFLRGFFRPINNRYYNSYHFLHYALTNLPGFIITLVLGIFVSPWILLAALVYPIDYLLFDRLLDKFWWKILWSRFYKDEVKSFTSQEYLMKEYERNPTPENYDKLHESVKKQS